MGRKWMRRAALAAALTATLAFAAPAQAAGWADWAHKPDLLQKAWQWLAGLWPAPEREGNPSPDLFKEGGGIDPMGNPIPPPPSSGNGG